MCTPAVRTPRRSDALSRQRIIDAAIDILDTGGDEALTVRALSSALSTGRGALYHHVAGMEDLMAAAADQLVTAAIEPGLDRADPHAAIRNLSLGLFDTIDAHPWIGAQLARQPFQPAVLRIWTSIGRHLHDLGVTGAARSDAGAALANYVFGSAAQFAAGARHQSDGADRESYLADLAEAWIRVDDDPGVRESATELRTHDDRAQFLAGVDIFLRGVIADLN